MTLETAILFLVALIHLIVVDCQHTGAFLHVIVSLNLLLVGGGIVTVVTLLLFSAAVQLIPLSLLGVLQYIAPSLQFLLGVLVYDEPMSTKLIGFILVWIALAIYTLEGLICRREKKDDVVIATPSGSGNSSISFEEIGIVYCVIAYIVWGVLPIYWKQLDVVPAEQLALHRIVWSFFFLLVVLTVTKQWTTFLEQARGWRVFWIYSLAGVLILGNWMTYIWAVNAGYIVQTSLGYFITPLINVVVGVVIFKEKLRKWQWAAIVLALGGVLVVAIAYGKFPWVAITLGASFSVYGVVKKQAPLNALHGLTYETGVLFIPSVIYLVVVESTGSGVFLHISTAATVLLIGAGIVTVIPLLLYSSAAQSIPFSLLGMLQYIAPSLMFIMGVAVYHESFSTTKLIGFILVWIALIIYSAEGYIFQKKQPKINTVDSPRDRETAYERNFSPRYFITPMINVIVGVVIFKEKLRMWQWVAIALALAGVLVVAIAYGKFPWVAITLGVSFSIYGFVKKQAPLNALHGLTYETGVLFNPSMIYLVGKESTGSGVLLCISTTEIILLIGAGIVTVIPLLLYSSAAQSIPFSLLGMLQYIAPSIVFIMGIAVYHESFSTTKLIGFILVWIALIIYSAEGYIFQKKEPKTNIVDTPQDNRTAYECGFSICWFIRDLLNCLPPLQNNWYVNLPFHIDCQYKILAAMRTGILHCVGAMVFWGFMPMYWKQLEEVPALELSLHRIVWALFFQVLGIVLTGRWSDFRKQISDWKVVGLYAIASVFIFANWLIDIWAINAGYILQTSLGYFLMPLISIVLGVLCFKEKPRAWQWLAIFLATSGVLVCAIAYGEFPWVAISLALVFAFYGVAKKKAPLNAFYGLTLETAILFPPSLVYLIVLQATNKAALGRVDLLHNFLLVGSGICTIVPLVLFASAAQRISLSLLGMLQYIAPSIIFIVGVVIYHEPFSIIKLVGFILVWIAVVLYSGEEFLHYKKQPKVVAVNSPNEHIDASFVGV
ncbi:hypothetical protein THRCLA_22397 [Thraustotheca clavata]|uniref:EamA domain-containing protein n=1 Tax=Thraustotheca clavata TaxID=74557 RepID=A0A1V9Z2F2_9STRA|nr:hypothetical protein THRCLA_22397 [Thraustotheca clavata]